MASGTLHNVGSLGFVRTPPQWAEVIVAHLLQFGAGANILDPTAGEGDLLVPCLALPQVRLFGVELSEERAEGSRTANRDEISCFCRPGGPGRWQPTG